MPSIRERISSIFNTLKQNIPFLAQRSPTDIPQGQVGQDDSANPDIDDDIDNQGTDDDIDNQGIDDDIDNQGTDDDSDNEEFEDAVSDPESTAPEITAETNYNAELQKLLPKTKSPKLINHLLGVTKTSFLTREKIDNIVHQFNSSTTWQDFLDKLPYTDDQDKSIKESFRSLQEKKFKPMLSESSAYQAKKKQETSDIAEASSHLSTIQRYIQKLKLDDLKAIPTEGPVFNERLRAKSLSSATNEALVKQYNSITDQLIRYKENLDNMETYFKKAKIQDTHTLLTDLKKAGELIAEKLRVISEKLKTIKQALDNPTPNQFYIYKTDGLTCRKLDENLPVAKSKSLGSGIARSSALEGSIDAVTGFGDEFFYDVDRNGVSARFKLSHRPIGDPASVSVSNGKANYIPPCSVEVVMSPFVMDGSKQKSASSEEQVKFYIDMVFAFLVANGGRPITKEDPITVYGKDGPQLWTALMVVGSSFGISEDAIKVQGFNPKTERGLTGYRAESIYKTLFEPNLSTVKDKVNEFKSTHQTLSQNSASLDTVVKRTSTFKEEMSKVKPGPTPPPGPPKPSPEEQRQPWMKISP